MGEGAFSRVQGHAKLLREGEMSSMPLEGPVSTGAGHPQQSPPPIPCLLPPERDALRGAGLSCRFQASEAMHKMANRGVSAGDGDKIGNQKRLILHPFYVP